ncbi:MAG: M15 family metallopeptidase [Clostridia bacterium]|nr:M15 family metallopeptidase [Clostridia bacterium]
MDEENQKKQPNAVEEFAKQNAKSAGKKIAKEAGKQALKLAQKAAAKLAAAVIGFIVAHIVPILIILAVIIALCVLLPAIDNFLDEDSAETIDEVTYQTVQEYCTIDDTGIHLDKESFLKNITVKLAENGIDLNALGFGDDENSLSNSNTILGNNINPNSQAAKYLYKFMSASLAGEFPYIPGSDEETQGIIKIKRRKDENEEPKDLTFIGYKTFQEMLKTDNDAEKEDIMNYFSLDESWNLCIAKYYKQTVNGVLKEYSISEVKIPYRDMVTQYTVPFMFLIDLQVITNNANYVEAVSELMTKQSEIEFTIFDSIIIDKTEYNFKADKHTRELESDEGLEEGEAPGYYTSVTGVDETTETITEIDNIKANVTKAKTWLIEQETNYVMNSTTEYPYGPNGTTKDLGSDEPITQGEGTWYENKKEYWYEEIIKNEWIKSGDTKTIITPAEFMGLWSNEKGTYEKGAKYAPVGAGKPGKIVKYKRLNGTTDTDPVIINIVTAREELYELLEKPATQNHAELMREMIRIYMNSEELTEDSFTKLAFISMYEPHEFVAGSYTGDFDVHDETLFVTDLDELKKAFQGGYSSNSKLVANAQAFLDMQEKYKVNAIFAAAVSITETSAGTKGNAINGCHNWFNMTGKDGPYKSSTDKYGNVHNWRIYENDAKGIEAFGIFISGAGATKRYYPQGNYTVGTIGPIYCPDSIDYPTQAEDWVATTLAQMSRFYEAIGIDISPIIEGGGISSEDLKDLFPNGVPTTAAEMQQYLTTITIDINDAKGNPTTTKITVHKAVAEDVKAIFKEIQQSGFKIKSVGGYSWRNAAASSSRSHHSYGIAIDINPTENYMIKDGKIISGSFWKPGENEYSITPNGPVVKAFSKRGWTWGGTWKSSKDYMHFSLTGH